MSGISTHVLDLTRGRPAIGMDVQLLRETADGAVVLTGRMTDEDGRVRDLLSGNDLASGTYRLRFGSGAYFASGGLTAFYPFVEIAIEVRNTSEHYHVPLLVTPHSYSTYRGS